VEEIYGENPACLGGQELSPAGPAATRCWVQACAFQDRLHGARRKFVAEPGKFTLNPPVAPRSSSPMRGVGPAGVALVPSSGQVAAAGLGPPSFH
jgi:hypothetical protein